MEPDITDYERGRAYFIVSSKHGEASLSIDHLAAGQSLTLPVFPSSAVEEALPLLHTPAAHYARQWRRALREDFDFDDRDASGFSVDAGELPDGIAPRSSAEEFYEIALRHAGEESRLWIEEAGRVIAFDIEVWPSNRSEFAHEIEFFGDIEPFAGGAAD